ncbi:unnamed protein product [Prunus armeniaca]
MVFIKFNSTIPSAVEKLIPSTQSHSPPPLQRGSPQGSQLRLVAMVAQPVCVSAHFQALMNVPKVGTSASLCDTQTSIANPPHSKKCSIPVAASGDPIKMWRHDFSMSKLGWSRKVETRALTRAST